MPEDKVHALQNAPTPTQPVHFNKDRCNGCNHCIEVCPVDVYLPHPEKGQPPIILHPDECWYCGCCVNDCPRPGSMTFNWPVQMKPYWKNKATGETHQI
jgi:NAD-dependent dihydropyrimidine dehydrogenase PreA subunit